MRAVGSFPPSAVSHGRVVTQLLADWPVRKTHHFSNPRIGQSSRHSARCRLSRVLRRGGGSSAREPGDGAACSGVGRASCRSCSSVAGAL